MSEESSMSVKAYLDVGGGRQEVRRFGMAEAVATNFTCLRDKVRSVFGLGQQDVTLSWKDSEGDMIVISSDEELVEAIADSMSKQKLPLFRINVTVGNRPDLGPNNSLPGSQQGAVHEGVVCDGCEGPVRGYRYRCLSCRDFDLCAACEFKGKHSEHRLIRMPKPEVKGAPKFWWKEHHGPPGHFSTHFGMHSDNENGASFSTSTSAGGGGTASASAGGASACGGMGGAGGGGGMGGAGGGWGGHGGSRRFRRGCGNRGRGWWSWWGGNNGAGCGQAQAQGNGWQQQQSQQQQQQQGQQGQQKQQQQQQQQASGKDGNSGKNTEDNKEKDCPWTSTSTGFCPYMNMEQDVAEEAQQVAEEASQMAAEVAQQAQQFASQMASEHVANVMRGIWTAWTGQQVNNPGTSTHTTHTFNNPGATTHTFSTSSTSSSSSSSSSTNGNEENKEKKAEKEQASAEELLRNVGESVATMLDPLGIDVEVSVEHNGIRQRCSIGSDNVQSRQSPSTSNPESPSKDQEAQTSTIRNIDIQTETEDTTQSVEPDLMDISSPETNADSQNADQMDAENSGASDNEDWTLVNQDSAQALPQATNAEGTEKRVEYPSLAELTPHPDSKIQDALEKMQAMGYNNDGGWLTKLLEVKGGDINQVLDVLMPAYKH